MADNLKIAIRLTADGSAFVGGVKLAREELGQLDAAVGRTDAALDAHGRAATRAAAEAQALATRSRALQEAQTGAARTTELLTRMVVALGASLTAGKVLEYADAWTQIGNRLKLATQDTAQMKAVQEQLFQAAQKAGVAVSSVVDIFARAAQSAKELGATQDQLTRFSGGVAQAVALSGSSAEAAAGALQQLGQALAAGTVHAEEFNSVLDGALRVAQAVASGLDAAGGSVGRLKELINDGKVSSKQFFDAFLSQIPRIEAEFGTAVPTMATAMTKLQNATMKLIGTTNDAVGATSTLARGITVLGDNLDTVAAGVLGLGGALAAVYVARGLVPAVTAAASFVSSQTALRAALVANTGHLLQKEAAMRASAAATAEAAAADLAAARAAQVRAQAERAARAAQFEATLNSGGVIGSTERMILAERQLAAARAANEAANDRVAASGAAAAQALRTQQEVMARTTLSATLLSRTGAGLSAVLGLVGGPWGAAFLGAGAAVYYLATRTTDADRAQEAYNRTLSDGRQRVQELATATRDQAAALIEKQRNDLAASQAAAAAAEAELAARKRLAKESMPGARPEELEGALGDLPKVVEIARKSVAAATAALDGMLAASQKTGDAVGLELASKLAKGTGAFMALDKSTSEAVKGLGLVVERGQLMSEEQATAEKQINALNRAIEAGPGFLRTWGSSIAQVTQLIEAIRLKIDPVKAAIADMNREIAQLRVPEGAERAALAQLQQINDARKNLPPLTTVSPEYLALLDKAKELETQRVQAAANARTQVLDLEKKIAQAQAAGNEKRVADLTRQKAVIEMVARGVDPAVAAGKAQQDFDVAVTAAGAAAGEAGQAFLRAADAQTRLAMAAGLGDAAMRQAAYANKLAEEAAKGNGNVAAQAAANRREEAAAILQIRNETVRGLELETANTNRLTEAMAAGGAAIRVAQEEEYRLTLIRKLGTDATVAGTAAQKALNDAMDAYRKNRAANDNNQLQKERQSANDNLALAERELELMGQSESLRDRALTTLRNQQEAARKVAELGEDGAKQWLAWQEKIADTRAMVSFQKEVRQTAKSISDDLAAKMFEKGGSILDWWRNLLKRMAIEIVSTQFIMPIVTQVVGAVPSLFGIQAPGASGQAQTGGSPMSSLMNTAFNKGASWALDKIGFSSAIDDFAAINLGIGGVSSSSVAGAAAASQLTAAGVQGATVYSAVPGVANSAVIATPIGANGAAVNAALTTANTPVAGSAAAGAGLSAYLGAAGAGAFGGMIGGFIGTAANSKALGGISGAALGAGSAYLASIMGLGAVGGPIGLAIGAIVGAVMGALGTQKKSVGPNSSAELRYSRSGVEAGDALADNGADAGAIQAMTDGVAKSVNTIVSGIGARWNAGTDRQDLAAVRWFQQGNKFYLDPRDGSGGRQEFGSQEEAISGLIKWTLQRLDQTGAVTDVKEDVRTALKNTKATKAEDLAADLEFAAGFRSTFNAMNSDLDPVSNQIKEFTDQAKKLGEQVKTNLLDWRDKARDLGLATEGELNTALKKGMMAMLGLGPTVEPLRGVAAITEQARINFEAIKPALGSVGYTAAEQADILARYLEKAKKEYSDRVSLIQRQGNAAVLGMLDPTMRVSAADRLTAAGWDMAATGISGLARQLDAFELTARSGTLSAADLRFTMGELDRLLAAGTITADQYGAAVQSLAQSWQAASAVALSVRQGQRAIDTAIDPTRRRDAAAVLDDAGIADTAPGVAAFRTQLDAFLRTAQAGSATAADLTYTHGQLSRLLTAGAITTQQYQTVLQSLTGAYTDATTAAAGTLDAIRRGSASITALTDPTRRRDATGILAEAGITGTGAGVTAFRTQLDAFLTTLRVGQATTADLTYTYGVLERLLTAGTITASQYETAVGSITGAWQDAASTSAEIDRSVSGGWTNAVNKAVQQVGDGWRQAADAARQAAADWTRVGDAMGQALDSLLVNRDLSNLGADAMLSETQRQFDAAAQTLMDYQGQMKLGREPSEEARKAAVDAAERLDGLGQRYLEEARAYGLGAEEYDRRLQQVQTLYATVRDFARNLSTAETSRAAGLDKQLDWLSKINETMSGTGATSAVLLERIIAALQRGETPTQTPADRAGMWMTDWFGRYNQLVADQQSGRLNADQVYATGSALWQEKVARANSLPADPAVWRAVVDAARGSARGADTADWFAALARDRGVPGFVAGGLHMGGARIVGERGRELEVTGPARYWSHDQTRDILSPKAVSVTVELAPVVTAIGGVTSAVMDIGRLITDLSRRVANVEEAITDLARQHGQLATQIRKVAAR